jgi:hypothetical protein
MLVWTTFWRFVGMPQTMVAVWSDGKRMPVGFFASWWLRRPPHLLVRLEFEDTTIWERKP